MRCKVENFGNRIKEFLKSNKAFQYLAGKPLNYLNPISSIIQSNIIHFKLILYTNFEN